MGQINNHASFTGRETELTDNIGSARDQPKTISCSFLATSVTPDTEFTCFFFFLFFSLLLFSGVLLLKMRVTCGNESKSALCMHVMYVMYVCMVCM